MKEAGINIMRLKDNIGKELEDLWYPYRWGLKLRKKILYFCRHYGGRFFKIRRPLVVFLSSLLDENSQEMFEKTPHYIVKNQ
jgi:hypothetical protein